MMRILAFAALVGGVNAGLTSGGKCGAASATDSELCQLTLVSAKVSDEVNEDKMPPKKYLKKHPEAQLTAEEKKTLVDWADGLAQSLVNK